MCLNVSKGISNTALVRFLLSFSPEYLVHFVNLSLSYNNLHLHLYSILKHHLAAFTSYLLQCRYSVLATHQSSSCLGGIPPRQPSPNSEIEDVIEQILDYWHVKGGDILRIYGWLLNVHDPCIGGLHDNTAQWNLKFLQLVRDIAERTQRARNVALDMIFNLVASRRRSHSVTGEPGCKNWVTLPDLRYVLNFFTSRHGSADPDVDPLRANIASVAEVRRRESLHRLRNLGDGRSRISLQTRGW